MSDKFFLIEAGRLPTPSKCWSCGAVDRDCIDWGRNTWDGSVLLCVLCVREAFSVLPQEIDQVKVAALARVAELEQELEGVNEAFLDRVGIFLGQFVNSGSGRITVPQQEESKTRSKFGEFLNQP